MSTFNADLQNYNVVAEHELAEVLSHYNSDFVFNIINDAIHNRYKEVSIIPKPNVVAAWNQNFEAMVAQYGQSHEINRVRSETFEEIINIICKEFGLDYIIDGEYNDLYNYAFTLYDFFVSNFNEYLTIFFAKFIYRERNTLYDSLNLSDLKKNKDTSTIYGKRIYKDSKLAIINANIEAVLNNIISMDIKFHTIIETIFNNDSRCDNILSFVSDNNNDFFTTKYASMFTSDIRADIITNIRLKLQEIAMEFNQLNNSPVGTEVE